MRDNMFNRMKLPAYLPLFRSQRVAILGVGAVGSHLAQILAAMGVGEILCIDFDTVEEDNLSKSSAMLCAEDIGKPKAHAVAARTQSRMIPGGKCHGIHADVRSLGPLAFANFDAVFLALDNYAAKELVNRLILQLPRRPVLGMAGTSGEFATAVLLDNEKFCLRCLFDESWLDSDIRTSCAGPQYMQLEGVSERIRTSGLASLMAASILAEKYRAWVLGGNAINTRTSYTPYPCLELLDTEPMAKQNCPDCGIRPLKPAARLDGSVWNLTLADALTQLSRLLETEDFILHVHLLEYNRQAYGGLIADEFCHHCGSPVSVYAHESRAHYHDILCPSCRQQGKTAYFDPDRPVGESVRFFSPQTSDSRLLGMTLFALGYPLGAHLIVTLADGRRYCFACGGDQAVLTQVDTL